MSIFAHVIVSYYVCLLLFGLENAPISLIAFFALLGDTDRLCYIWNNKRSFSWNHLIFGSLEYRTLWQEVLGVLLVSLVLGAVYFFIENKILIQIAALSFLLRFVMDFLTATVRPLYPFIKVPVKMAILGNGRFRIYGDIIVTFVCVLLIVFKAY